MSKSNKTNAAYHAHKKAKLDLKRINSRIGDHENTDLLFLEIRKSGVRHGNNRQYFAKLKVYKRKVARLQSKKELVFESVL